MSALENERPIDRLLRIMRALRAPDGCPWDREQTLESLRPFLIEESHEVVDAIDSGDRAQLADELGDLLLQVVFQAQIASEEGSFTFDTVASAIADKLVRRHPNVFGDATAADADAVVERWEAIKREEKGSAGRSVLEGIPRSLPGLMKAEQVQRKAARVGFDWSRIEDVEAKCEEEWEEFRAAVASESAERQAEEFGDLLFALVNLARFLKLDAEGALQGCIHKFTRRFGLVERRVAAEGRALGACSLDELDAHWNEVKRGE